MASVRRCTRRVVKQERGIITDWIFAAMILKMPLKHLLKAHSDLYACVDANGCKYR